MILLLMTGQSSFRLYLFWRGNALSSLTTRELFKRFRLNGPNHVAKKKKGQKAAKRGTLSIATNGHSTENCRGGIRCWQKEEIMDVPDWRSGCTFTNGLASANGTPTAKQQRIKRIANILRRLYLAKKKKKKKMMMSLESPLLVNLFLSLSCLFAVLCNRRPELPHNDRQETRIEFG